MKMNLLPCVTLIAMAQFDLKQAVVRFYDGAVGTGLPHRIDVSVGDGNITYSEMKNREYLRDRGRLSDVRNAQEEPVDVSIDLIYTNVKGQTTTLITPVDALKRIGGASAWVSTDADACRPYAIGIEIFYDPACSTEKIEKTLLVDFRYEKLDYDLKAGMIKCTGKCNTAEASVQRVAQTV